MSTEGMCNRILVVGDANVDLVLTGDVVPRFGQAEQLLDGASLVLGGSASIVASGLAKLGVDTHLVAVVGDDEFGAFTRKALERARVGVGSIVIDPRLVATRSARRLSNSDSDAQYSSGTDAARSSGAPGSPSGRSRYPSAEWPACSFVFRLLTAPHAT